MIWRKALAIASSVPGVTDEEERAEGRHFPAGEHPLHVVGEHDDVHGGEEHEHQREEHRATIRRSFRLMGLEILHVAQSVDADAASHHADDEGHQQRERVEVQAVGHLDAVGEHELQDERTDYLHAREHGGPQVLVAHGEPHDDRRDGHGDAVQMKSMAMLSNAKSVQLAPRFMTTSTTDASAMTTPDTQTMTRRGPPAARIRARRPQ